MRQIQTAETLPLAAVSALWTNAAPTKAIYLPQNDKEDGVLFRGANGELPKPDFERLQTSGVTHLLVECEDLARHEAELENNLSTLLSDPKMDPTQKAACVRHFGIRIAHDIAACEDIPNQVNRANHLLDAIVDNVLANKAACESLLSMCSHHRSTASHMFAVSTLGILLGNEVFGNDAPRLRRLGLAGMVHDLGKVSVPEDVLRKATPLTPDELELLRHHPIESVRLLGEEASIPADVRTMVLQHHERFDGKGYPLGLSASDLLIESRILTIVDSFHAMIGRRDYRRPLSPIQAIELMRFQAGRQFDPDLFARFERLVRHDWRILDSRALGKEPVDSVGPGFHADHHRPQPRRYTRAAPRNHCGGGLILPMVYTGRLSHLEKAPGIFHPRVTDVSKSGLSFASGFPFYRGEVVSIRVSTDGPDIWVRGLIRWSRRDAGKSNFRTGVQFLHRIGSEESTDRVSVMPTDIN